MNNKQLKELLVLDEEMTARAANLLEVFRLQVRLASHDPAFVADLVEDMRKIPLESGDTVQ